MNYKSLLLYLLLSVLLLSSCGVTTNINVPSKYPFETRGKKCLLTHSLTPDNLSFEEVVEVRRLIKSELRKYQIDLLPDSVSDILSQNMIYNVNIGFIKNLSDSLDTDIIVIPSYLSMSSSKSIASIFGNNTSGKMTFDFYIKGKGITRLTGFSKKYGITGLGTLIGTVGMAVSPQNGLAILGAGFIFDLGTGFSSPYRFCDKCYSDIISQVFASYFGKNPIRKDMENNESEYNLTDE
jgi:hypothetical protein